MEKHGLLEIDEQYQHHVRGWRVKRFGWVLMAMFVAAGLCGFLGNGPFTKGRAQGPGELRANYQRVARFNAPAHIELTVPGGKEDLEISISAEVVKQLELERIDPEPKEMRLSGDKHTWIFPRENASSRVFIHYRPQGFGRKNIRLEFKDAGALELQQLFIP